MMTYAIAAIGGIALLLLSLKFWTAGKVRQTLKQPGMVYKTSSSDIDLFVVGAEDWWPHLRYLALFWVSAAATLILLILDFHFGYSRYGWLGLVFLGGLFAIADLAIPIVALKDAVDDGKRGAAGYTLLTVFTLMSYVVVIGSTAEISTTSGARNDAGAIAFKDTAKVLALKQAERDSIPVDRGAQALEDLAKSTEEASGREKDRVRCGDKCEALKKQAADYRARAAEAKRKERLTGEIEALKTRMAGGGEERRLDADPLASAIEGMSGGYLSRDSVRAYGLTVVGILLVTAMTVMWVVVGGQLRDEIAWEIKHRGEIGDEARAQLGLPPKFTTPLEPLKALPSPAEQKDSITIIAQVADMRKRYANDEQLLETDSLFEKLLMRGEGGHVTIAALHHAYRVMILTADPSARHMTQPTMAQKLTVISQHRDDVRVTADGILQGWVLKPAMSRNTETANA